MSVKRIAAPSPRQRMRIAVAADCCEKTVLRTYQGGGTEFSRARIARAAADLGLPCPPPRDEHDVA